MSVLGGVSACNLNRVGSTRFAGMKQKNACGLAMHDLHNCLRQGLRVSKTAEPQWVPHFL
jgi:hypothetical protein